MAYIDLKNVHIFIEDGFTLSGTVGTGGGTMGGTTLPLAGITGIVPAGAQLVIAGDTTIYSVVTHTETSGNTTSVTLTPVLAAAVTATTAVTVGPNALEVKVGEGNLTYDEKRAIEYKKNRGLLDQTRLGDQDPIDVNMQFAWEYLTSTTGSTPTVEEALKQIGNASGWVSTGLACEPFAVNIVLKNLPPGCAGLSHPNEFITLPQFRYESLNHDPKAGSVTVQGKCNALVAVITRP